MSHNHKSLDGEGRLEFLVPPKRTISNPLAVKKQTFSRSEQQALSNAPSLAVDSVRLPRTAATWGITGPELNRLCNAVWFMELHCNSRVGLWLATTARATQREAIADIWKRISRLQGMHRLRCYSVITFESRGGLHAHITFLGTRDIAKRLRQSARFGERLDIRPVTDPDGLTRKYLAKERTPQAGYGREYILGGRIRGSHRLPGGGDRVRLSRELERDAIEAGYVEPWQHTNAKRSVEEKSCRPRPCSSRRREALMHAPERPSGSFLRPSESRHCFGRNDLVWDGLKLKLGARVTATIEPDANWPGMWRVRFGGKLSDMANLSRAKDAAISIALRELNANS